MSNLEQVNLIRSFLAAPDGCASPAEVLAWEDFCLIQNPRIRAVIGKYHACWKSIDDIAQDVWLILVRRLRKSRLDPAVVDPGAWVVAVARRLACRHGRRAARRKDAGLTPEIAADLVDPNADLATKRERNRRQQLVRAILEKLGASLPGQHHRIILLRWEEDRSVAKIAAELGLSEATVWGVLHRVVLKLPDLLRRAGLGSP